MENNSENQTQSTTPMNSEPYSAGVQQVTNSSGEIQSSGQNAAQGEELKGMEPKLFQAVALGNSELFTELVEEKPERLDEVTLVEKNTVLHLATMSKQKEIMKIIVDKRKELVYRTNELEETPLHSVARMGNTEMAEILLNAVADETEEGQRLVRMVNNPRKSTALHLAAGYGHLEMVKKLLQKDEGLALLENEAGEGPLFIALVCKYQNVARNIMEIAPDCSLGGEDGKNVLHAAAALTSVTSFSALISRTALPFICGEQRVFPFRELLEKAVEKCGTAVMEQRDNKLGWTPLHYAVLWDNFGAVVAILEKNPRSGYLTDKEGKTPLHLAAEKGRVEVLKKYYELCPDSFEQTDSKGRNTLHIAVQSDKKKAVKFIVHTPGLESLIVSIDNDGDTPRNYAHKVRRYSDIFWIIQERYDHTYGSIADGSTKASVIKKNFLTIQIISIFKPLGTLIIRLVTPVLKIAIGSILSDPKEDEEAKRERKKRWQKVAQSNIMVGALVAAATFVAAIQAPGGVNDKGIPFLKQRISYQIFYAADAVAFITSIIIIVANFNATYHIDSRAPDSIGELFVETGLLTFVSLVAFSVAFGAGLDMTCTGDNGTPDRKPTISALFRFITSLFDTVYWLFFSFLLFISYDYIGQLDRSKKKVD